MRKWYSKEREYHEPEDRSQNRRRRKPDRYSGKRYYYSDSSSSYESSNSPRKREKSGINTKPNSNVKAQQKYPHFSLGQVSGFIGQNIQFYQLTFEQFVAGELTTISKCTDTDEIIGRTELLQRVALWKLRANVNWAQVRNAYAHIIRKIENMEISWRANWDQFERHIYDKITNLSDKPKTEKAKKTQGSDTIFFCKQFQKLEGCNRDSPHNAKVGNSFKQVHHICANCWLKDRTRRNHAEHSTECPHKEI